MNILSLFDGISCAYESLNRAGIKITNYYACEIDKNAITISNKNHPDILRPVNDVVAHILKAICPFCEYDELRTLEPH